LNRGKRFCRPLRNHSATWPSEGSSLNVYSRLGNGWRRWAAAGRDGGALRVSRPHHPSRLSNAAVDARLTGSRNPSRRRFLERKAPAGATEISITIGARTEFERELVHIRPGRPRPIVVHTWDVSRHKSMDVLQAYVCDADLFRDHAGAELL
jgi:hypothetical protein